jgi:RimJ/RimL family protein N-acetyltransferase
LVQYRGGLSHDAFTMKTQRLELVPQAPEHFRALIEGPEQYEQGIGVRPAEGLRDFVVSPELSPDFLARLQATTGPDPWVYGFALVHAADRAVIGTAGFKGPPAADGVVEIAYGVVPAYQGQGFATEAARALVAYAFADGRVRVVRAHTRPQSKASMRVLTKCGFRHVGEVVDPEDGLVWRWETDRRAD